MSTTSVPESARLPLGDQLLAELIPRADHRVRHETLVRAPADLVLEVACDTDLQAHPLVRAVFRLRERLLGAAPLPPRRATGLVAETLGLGWGVLADHPGRCLVVGAVTRPWEPSVVFRAVPPSEFAAFAEPGLVKIAWTLEAEPLGPELTRFRTQTRVEATDGAARRRFRRYWLAFGLGIQLIRRLLLPQIRREAERRHRSRRT